MRVKAVLFFVWVLFWALFVNAVNRWLLIPVVLDYAAVGLLLLTVIVLLWILSIPLKKRRSWIGLTVFSLLLGTGAGNVLQRDSVAVSIVILLIMSLGLMALTRLLTKARLPHLFGSAIVIIVANAVLPLDLWPFLTNFGIAYRADLPMASSDFPSLPMEVAGVPGDQKVVTLQLLQERPKDITQRAEQATQQPGDLEDELRNANHRYRLVAVTDTKRGGFHLEPLTPVTAKGVDPFPLVTTFFPTIRAEWNVEGGDIVQYMVPAESPAVLTRMATSPGNLVPNLNALAEQTESAEVQAWNNVTGSSNVSGQDTGLVVVNGYLEGQWAGHSVHIRVGGTRVIGAGSFTSPGAKEVALAGPNLLQIVSLPDNKVVSTYHGTPTQPLTNDVVSGPLDKSGQDVLFVNSSPAQIIKATTTDAWRVLYTAPNASFRFEASVPTRSKQPEVITDDPSLMRRNPTRYFTGYQYQNGNLERIWRVYHTDVVHVHTIQFQPHGPTYLSVGIYGSGQVLLLRQHHIPVVQISSGVLALVIIGGFALRIRRKGTGAHE